MIDFFSYNPTDQEVELIFGRPVKEVKADPQLGQGNDWEIYQTACLFVLRGEGRAALQLLKEMKDELYREEMEAILIAEIELPRGAVW